MVDMPKMPSKIKIEMTIDASDPKNGMECGMALMAVAQIKKAVSQMKGTKLLDVKVYYELPDAILMADEIGKSL